MTIKRDNLKTLCQICQYFGNVKLFALLTNFDFLWSSRLLGIIIQEVIADWQPAFHPHLAQPSV